MTEPTDKDRLDWLDSHNVSVCRSSLGYYRLVNLDGPFGGHTGTIREAIDSAMAAERSGAPGAFGEGVGK